MEKRQETIRRLQTGGLGLLSVLLLIGLTGLISTNNETVDSGEVNASNGLDMPSSNEPLAELGVQPPLNDGETGNEVVPVPPAAKPSQNEPVVRDLDPDPQLERMRRDGQTPGG